MRDCVSSAVGWEGNAGLILFWVDSFAFVAIGLVLLLWHFLRKVVPMLPKVLRFSNAPFLDKILVCIYNDYVTDLNFFSSARAGS